LHIFLEEIAQTKSIPENASITVLDSPSVFKLPLEERMKIVKENLNLELFSIPDETTIKSGKQLEDFIAKEASKDYYLLLRKPNSLYFQESTHFELKVGTYPRIQLIFTDTPRSLGSGCWIFRFTERFM
jgi:hypothetical protein